MVEIQEAGVKYKRIMLKLSGEILAGENSGGIDPDILNRLVAQIREVSRLGVQIAIVIGGGNIFRGIQAGSQGLDRITGDYMGMLATAINALALQDRLEAEGVDTRVLSAIEMKEISEPYIKRRATRHLEKGAGRYLRVWHREPILYDRYSSESACHGDGGRDPA